MATKPKVALVTGITGQDGSYLAELLLDKGYIVHGIWVLLVRGKGGRVCLSFRILGANIFSPPRKLFPD